jgi:predicted porin
MKKLLMSSVALCGLTLASPALADNVSELGGLDMTIGGYYKGYAAFVDQDEAAGLEARSFDWLQNTEVDFNGEVTLDNGLTVGAHIEGEADSDDSFEIEESYAYFAGAWGRINAGAENGAVYLLQVDAPSADANYDGIRQYVQPINYNVAFGAPTSAFGGALGVTTLGTTLGGTSFVDVDGSGALSANDVVVNSSAAFSDFLVFDYDDDISGYSNKATYMTPVFNGFQAGVSYTFENDDDARSLEGVHAEDEAGDYGETYEIAARYEGQFNAVGFAVGGGYSHSELEEDAVIAFTDADADGVQDAGEATFGVRDDRKSWNVGLDIDVAAFGIGVAYVEDDLGIDDGGDRDTLVVGVDYTNGPWKLGASYYNQDQELDFLTGTSDELETDRYTGGVVYTYGPGMTFRGSISYTDHESSSLNDVEATSVLLGTQINF